MPLAGIRAMAPENAGPKEARPTPKLLDRLREAIRLRHYGRRTEEAYVGWVRRYILFHDKRHPAEMAERDVTRFLSHLAQERQVSASTQNQALCSILFLYRHVTGRPLGRFDGLVWAKRSAHVPSVLTRDEVVAVLGQMADVPWQVCALLYGAGLRLSECLELRVKDLDVGGGQVIVRSGKGGKDRRAPLPFTLVEPLEEHLAVVRRLHGRDLAAGCGRVAMPDALAVKYPHAVEEWGWQFVFPAGRICRDPRWGAPSRFHLHESVVQRRNGGGPPGWADQACDLPFVSALVCDPSSRRRVGHPDGAGTARPQGCQHDDGVHACVESRTAGCSESGRSPSAALEEGNG